jgi:hypothetical protein
VYFTSAVIVTSAVLFQGFNGTPIEITTVVMGFLQICSGVVLLQLSKSAKDVPDAAIFKGDLDQVLTVAEQEEPEYEPRADTIRGGAALLRSISKVRQSKQMQEIGRLREEHMAPINENDQVEFDGLRRRRTIQGPGPPSSPDLNRRKTIHPPLGMSHFPTEDEAAEDDDMHPGIFRLHWKRDRSSTNTTNTTIADASMPLSSMKVGDATHVEDVSPSHHQQQEGSQPQTYSLSPSLHQDTAYKGAPQHVQFADSARPSSPPPPPPPHKDPSKRQFSFQNPFQRSSATTPSGSAPPTARPVSRGALSFASRRSTSRATRNGTTEEERLGLVKGDSATEYGFSGRVSPEGSSDGEGEGEKESRRKVSAPGLGIEVGRLTDVERLPSAKTLGDGAWRGDSG